MKAWQIETRRSYDEHGGDYEMWRRAIAAEWLCRGDTRPVQELLANGEALGDELSRLLAAIMDPEWQGFPSELLPVELKIARRDGKSGNSDLVMSTFRNEVANRVKDWMATGSSLDGAIATVIEEFNHIGLNYHTVKSWYRARHGRKARAKKGNKPLE